MTGYYLCKEPSLPLLLGRSRGLLIHALLHARLVIGFHLLQLSLLVIREQLIELVMNLGLLNGELSLNLRFLPG